MWFFNWWRFAFAHGLNPFITDWVWAPLGINLTWTTCQPLLSILTIPLQLTLGEPATYNIVVALALPLAAFSAFLLCHRVTGAFWPSVVGGYLFGFSPYMLGQVLTHLDLVSVFPVPLIALLTLKRLDAEISARRFTILLAALLTILFLSFPELFATVTIVSGFSLILALALFGEEVRHATDRSHNSRDSRLCNRRRSPIALPLLHAGARIPSLSHLEDGQLFSRPTGIRGPNRDSRARHRARSDRNHPNLSRRPLRERRLPRPRNNPLRRSLSPPLLARANRKISYNPLPRLADRLDRTHPPRGRPARIPDAVGAHRPPAAALHRTARALHDVRLPGRIRDARDVARRRFLNAAAKMDRSRRDPRIRRTESARVVLGKPARHPGILHRPNLRDRT